MNHRFHHHASLISSSASSFLLRGIPEIYCSCDISIIPTVTKDNDNEPSSSDITITNANNRNKEEYQTTACFLDTKSRRAKVVIPILLTFENEFDRKAMIRSGAIQPLPPETNDKDACKNNTYGDNNDSGLGQLPSRRDRADISDIWSSELDTLGETRGGSVLDRTENMELKFECICNDIVNAGTNNNDRNASSINKTIVEEVTILSTTKVDLDDDLFGIRFDVEVAVRSSSSSSLSLPSSLPLSSSLSYNESKEDELHLHNDTHIHSSSSIFKTRLQIRSVLICTSTKPSTDDHYQHYLPSSSTATSLDNIYLANQALDLAINGISPYEPDGNLPTSSYFTRSLSYTLPPINTNSNSAIDNKNGGLVLNLTLVPALSIDVMEISASSSDAGITLVSLIISHSNLHNENVTITNIALHPGHSKLYNYNNTTSNENKDGLAMPGGEHSVINMTKNVRWGYGKGTAPSLPLILHPQDAISTIIQINASDLFTARTFVSPLCVRGIVVGKNKISSTTALPPPSPPIIKNHNNTNDGSKVLADTFRDKDGNNTSMIMVSADAKWTTFRVATEKADAFRINLSVEESQCFVGSQVVVSLKVMNLSDATRNLTLVMAKEENLEEEGGMMMDNHIRKETYAGGDVKDNLNSISKSVSTHITKVGINNAIVREVNGYTFSVWGLCGNDDGTVRYSRDHELLAIDAALSLGEVKGQHSIEAELRFVPLREGTLKVPNLRLFDNYNQSWYNCCHTLRIIAVSNQ